MELDNNDFYYLNEALDFLETVYESRTEAIKALKIQLLANDISKRGFTWKDI